MPRHQGLVSSSLPIPLPMHKIIYILYNIYYHRIVLYPKDFLRSLTADKLSKGMFSLSK